MRHALSKPHLRVAAVDDGSFSRRNRYAPVAGVVVSLPNLIEAVVLGRVRVDGTDSTEQIVAMLRALPHLEGVRAVLVDGISMGGFNVLDLDALSAGLEKPVVSVTRRPPDYASISSAIRKYFPKDARRRWRLIRAHRLFSVSTEGTPIWASAAGCRRGDAIALVHRSTVRGFWPEPLRIARMVARAASA